MVQVVRSRCVEFDEAAWVNDMTAAAVTPLLIDPMPIIAVGTTGAPSPSLPAAPDQENSAVTTAAVIPRSA